MRSKKPKKEKPNIVLPQIRCLVCLKAITVPDEVLEALQKDFEVEVFDYWNLCPEHELMHEKGIVHIVVIKPFSSETAEVDPNAVERVGLSFHVTRGAFEKLFKKEKFSNYDQALTKPVVWIDEDMAERLLDQLNTEEDFSCITPDHHSSTLH